MSPKKPSHTKIPRKLVASSSTLVACWEDDPGDPKSTPALIPITVPVPNQAAQPYPYKLQGKAPAPQIYQPGNLDFVYYANAAALRRTADFWGSIVPSGTNWELGKTLPVFLDSGVDFNAFYTRGDGGDKPGLHFFHGTEGGRVFFSAESPDVCCHEMGHGVLDSLRPQLFDAQSIESAAFHESFADMSAILSALQVPTLRTTLLAETNGAINRSSRLSRLAEQLGAAIRAGHPDAVDPDCLRNAANSFFYRDPQTLPPNAPASQLSSEPHNFSRVFTGGFLDALAGMFKLQGGIPSPDGLVQVSRDMAQLLVAAVSTASVVPDYFSQAAAQLVQAGETAPFNGKYRDVLKSAFVRRGILSLQAAATLSSVRQRAPRTMSLLAAGQAQTKARPLTMSSISASQYGLNKNVLKVHTASEPKHLAVTGASLQIGPSEPRSAQSAAESYTEDLFQRGHVDSGKHSQDDGGIQHPYSFKTHVIAEENGELILKRITFDCGFHFPFDRPF